MVRTCVQANVVDLGGPGLGNVPANAGGDGHPHACARISKSFVQGPCEGAENVANSMRAASATYLAG